MMVIAARFRSIQSEKLTLYHVLLPVIAALLELLAGCIPWLHDPLGARFIAWQLPIYLGWQLPAFMTAYINYGVLCCLCSLLMGWSGWLTWRDWCRQRAYKDNWDKAPRSVSRTFYLIVCLCSLLPLLLFVFQYLYADMDSVAVLTNHVLQERMIKSKFGYGTPALFVPIQTMSFDPITLHGRVALFVNQVSGGGFLLLIGALLLFSRAMRQPEVVAGKRRLTQRQRLIIGGLCALFTLIVLGRAPLALACNYQAQHLLSTGNYYDALTWLDRAELFNPSLAQLPSYHIERGRAWHFLHPSLLNSDSQVFLGAFYRQQADYASSYQTLSLALAQDHQNRWLRDEFSVTLARLVELSHPLNGAPDQRLKREMTSLPWLLTLTQVDNQNVYAHYVLARLKYDIGDYNDCEEQMNTILHLTNESEIISSAYTYLALSHFRQGDLVVARRLLFLAQDFDPTYRNNTAREEMSGLH